MDARAKRAAWGVVFSIVRSNRWLFGHLDDLFQEASIGWLEALKKHDPKKGSLSTIGGYYMRRAVWQYVKRLAVHIDRSSGENAMLLHSECRALPSDIKLDTASVVKSLPGAAKYTTARSRKLATELAASAVTVAAHGGKLADVARMHGVSREYVRQVADKLGIERLLHEARE